MIAIHSEAEMHSTRVMRTYRDEAATLENRGPDQFILRSGLQREATEADTRIDSALRRILFVS